MNASESKPTWGCTVHELSFSRPNGFRLGVTSELSIRCGDAPNNRIPIMGKSGCGKTTFLHLISAACPPNEETVISWKFPDGRSFAWDERGLGKSELVELRRDYFGFAFQTPHVPDFMTIGEALIFGKVLRGVSEKDAIAHARSMVGSTFAEEHHGQVREREIDKILASYPGNLSGGQRQRASLLMAMARDPVVLFADEPTGSLDPETRLEVMNLLYSWLNEERMLIWVTHHEDDLRLSEASRSLRIKDGKARLIQ